TVRMTRHFQKWIHFTKQQKHPTVYGHWPTKLALQSMKRLSFIRLLAHFSSGPILHIWNVIVTCGPHLLIKRAKYHCKVPKRFILVQKSKVLPRKLFVSFEKKIIVSRISQYLSDKQMCTMI